MELFPANGTTSNKGRPVSVVPFGKYKGQPVEVLQQDPQYVEWLQGQDWFRERHQNIYTIIVNNFGEPDETPEHNAIQARFLDDGFCLNFIQCATHYRNIFSVDPEFEVKGIDVRLNFGYWSFSETRVRWASGLSVDDSLWRDIDVPEIMRAEFKHEDDHVRIFPHDTKSIKSDSSLEKVFLNWHEAESSLLVEIKPVLGDDFPAVMRKMLADGARYLLIGSYRGVGATFEQVCMMYKKSGLRLVTMEEIDSMSDEADFTPDPPVEQRKPEVRMPGYHHRFIGGPVDGMSAYLTAYTHITERLDETGVLLVDGDSSGHYLWEDDTLDMVWTAGDPPMKVEKQGRANPLFSAPMLRKP